MTLTEKITDHVLYEPVKHSILKFLLPINSVGFRLATGAFPTSSIYVILCEANITPVETRRKQLSLSYARNKLLSLSNPIYNIVKAVTSFNNCRNKPKVPKSFNLRFKQYLRSLQIDLLSIIPGRQYQLSEQWKYLLLLRNSQK